jgi:hypothetical protein
MVCQRARIGIFRDHVTLAWRLDWRRDKIEGWTFTPLPIKDFGASRGRLLYQMAKSRMCGL